MKRPILRRRASAQSLTELAFMMPLLGLLFVGLIEFGFLLHAHVQVASAAREAARDASRYNSLRFSYFLDSAFVNGNNVKVPDCPRTPTSSTSDTVPGWPLQAVVENAIVRRAGNTTTGCPNPAGAIQYSALGRLNPAQAPSTTTFTPPRCPTGNASGWVISLHNFSPAFTQTSSPSSYAPPAGGEATVTLCYPHRLVLLSGMLNLGDPVWISKSVVFQFHQ